ncbi:hypothetical protein [Amycolatopsis benzoatilytica]|uniref:hypothetical protein n=1 Tax=Amycolatopsis benzoatilytica TaxID=346045 RepID=UPI000374AF49|nr:hypothetical protein [Amycolatopsis benzoatilytica]
MTQTRGYRPRWGWFALFAAGALVHPWDSTAKIRLPIGFAVTLLLVFVPRWPSVPPRVVAPVLAGLAVVFAGLVVAALIVEKPEASEAGAAVFVAVVEGLFLTGSLLWWRSVRRPAPARGKGPLREVRAVLDGETSQWDHRTELPRLLRVTVRPSGYLTLLDCPAEQARELRRAERLRLTEPDERGRVQARIGKVAVPGLFTKDPTGLPVRPSSFRRARMLAAIAVPVAVLVVAAAAGGVLAAFWFIGGSGWPTLLLALFWGGLAAMWAGQVREDWRSLQGPLIPRWAALADRHVWPGAPVRGWMVMEPGWPVRFEIEHCPPDFAAELLDHRRVWLHDAPTLGVAAFGLPGQDGYVKAVLYPTGRRAWPQDEPEPEAEAGVPVVAG